MRSVKLSPKNNFRESRNNGELIISEDGTPYMRDEDFYICRQDSIEADATVESR